MEEFLPETDHFATSAIHTGQNPDQRNSKCVVPPIVMSSIFKMPGAGFMDEYGPDYFYGRYKNPTRVVLEETLAALEGAKYGFVFPSGMAAITAACTVLRPGDHLITTKNIYGGSFKYFQELKEKSNIQVTFVGSPIPQNVQKVIKDNTKLVWIETPTNPLLEVIDIKHTAEVLKSSKAILAVDNTFLTPFFQRPLEYGADIVMYSCTKYMNGHSDIIMGAITTNNDDLGHMIHHVQKHHGSVPSPFDCFLVHRGLKTLHLRMREHMKNGFAVAEFLQIHPCVDKVIHPGFSSHPQHNLAKKQSSGHSGMVSFYIKGGITEAAKFITSLKVFMTAPSLGTDISLASIPGKLSHSFLCDDERKSLGITDNLVRIHVGLETIGDILEDLDQALTKAVPI